MNRADVLITSSVLREDACTATAASMNITANGSSSWSCHSLLNPVVQRHVPTVAYGLLLVASLIGNSVIVMIVFKTPALRKLINFMIVNMAIPDLLIPIFLFPHFFAFKRVEHPGGMVMCAIQKSSASYYLLAYFIAFFYLPFVLLIILYAIILIKLKQHAHPGEQSAIAKEMRSRRNRNVLKSGCQ